MATTVLPETVEVVQWNPLTNPDCTNCNGLSRPVRRKKKPEVAYDCIGHLPQLRLNKTLGEIKRERDKRLETRSLLTSITYRAELPYERVARLLGMSPVTMWRMMEGKGTIHDEDIKHLRSIEYIKRDGAYTHVIYHTGTPSPRWDFMKKKRKREKPQIFQVNGQVKDLL